VHRALYHRVGAPCIHSIENAVDDLITCESQEGGAEYLLLSRSGRIFMNPVVSPRSFARLTRSIARIGVQPVFTRVPPNNLRSMIATFQPAAASRRAKLLQ
jgi:hypothetical protein